MVDACVFRCGCCGHSWVGAVTAEPDWNVLIFFSMNFRRGGFCCIALIPDHQSGLVWFG